MNHQHDHFARAFLTPDGVSIQKTLDLLRDAVVPERRASASQRLVDRAVLGLDLAALGLIPDGFDLSSPLLSIASSYESPVPDTFQAIVSWGLDDRIAVTVHGTDVMSLPPLLDRVYAAGWLDAEVGFDREDIDACRCVTWMPPRDSSLLPDILSTGSSDPDAAAALSKVRIPSRAARLSQMISPAQIAADGQDLLAAVRSSILLSSPEGCDVAAEQIAQIHDLDLADLTHPEGFTVPHGLSVSDVVAASRNLNTFYEQEPA